MTTKPLLPLAAAMLALSLLPAGAMAAPTSSGDTPSTSVRRAGERPTEYLTADTRNAGGGGGSIIAI